MNYEKSKTQLLTEVNPIYYKGMKSVCDHGWYFDNILPGYDKFYYIIDGSCTIKINGAEYTARPNQLFLLPYNSVQTLYTEPESTVTKHWFHCSLPCGDRDITELINLPHFIEVKDSDYIENLFLKLYKKEKEQSLTAKLEQKALVLEMLAYYIKASRGTEIDISIDGRITQILSYINDNLSKDISLEELSEMMHFNPSYFIRFFKSATGITPISYILNRRIALAQKLLLDEKATIKDVSLKAGFQNTRYFSRYFKKITGFSPASYQQIAINKVKVNNTKK